MRLDQQQKEKLASREWSYSSLSKFKQCPYSFFDVYVEGRRVDIPAAFFGKAFHKYVELYFKGERDIKTLSILESHKVPPELLYDFEMCVTNFIKFRLGSLGRSKVESEKQIKFKHDGYNFIVIIDLLVERGAEVVDLYDFKTSKMSDYFEEYRDQINLYSWVVENELKKKVSKRWLFYPRVGDKELIELPPHPISTMTENVILIERILSSDFPPCPNKFCSTCNVFKDKRCPAFKSPMGN